MTFVNGLLRISDRFTIFFDDGSHVTSRASNGTSFPVPDANNGEVVAIDHWYGELLVVRYVNGDRDFAYPSGGYNWYCRGTHIVSSTLIDTYLPAFSGNGGPHTITNPGGTVDSGWAWHVSTASGRGGDDMNYNFQNFYAPADGTVRHFDVATVGMVVVLQLDTPRDRTLPQLSNDAYGPMVAIWHEHCSAAYDGHHKQGELIGVSGDGYGQYPAHLHVHGLIDNGNSAGSTNRCCFWKFL